MKDKEEIGKLIATKRKELQMTQQELANLLNVSDKAISNWETGKNYPDYTYLNDISKILGIELTEKIVKKDNKVKKTIMNILKSIILVSFIFLFIFFVINYNQYKKYDISSSNEIFNINESYLYITKEEIIFHLDEITNSEDLKMNNPIIKIYDSKNNKIFEKQNNEATILIETKNNNEIFNKEILNNLDDLYIEIKYINSNNEEKIRKLKLEFKLNKTKSNKKTSQDIIILLNNNNYQKISDEKYKKEYPEYTFYFYPQKNKMIYIKNTNKEAIYAEMQIKGQNQHLKYEILKDNKLIEKYDSKKKNESDNYMWEIHEVMYNEYLKISTN